VQDGVEGRSVLPGEEQGQDSEDQDQQLDLVVRPPPPEFLVKFLPLLPARPRLPWQERKEATRDEDEPEGPEMNVVEPGPRDPAGCGA
jgi:hypothetical protein